MIDLPATLQVTIDKTMKVIYSKVISVSDCFP